MKIKVDDIQGRGCVQLRSKEPDQNWRPMATIRFVNTEVKEENPEWSDTVCIVLCGWLYSRLLLPFYLFNRVFLK